MIDNQTGLKRSTKTNDSPSSHSVRDVPVEHRLGPLVSLRRAVEDETESAVDHFAPSDSAAVVQRDPSGASERIANAVLDGHISREGRSVVNVGRLAERTVRAADVVMIAADDDTIGDLSVCQTRGRLSSRRGCAPIDVNRM